MAAGKKTTACAPTGGQERRQPVGLSARPSERMAERNRSRYVADVTPRLRSIMRWDCIHQSILDKREYAWALPLSAIVENAGLGVLRNTGCVCVCVCCPQPLWLVASQTNGHLIRSHGIEVAVYSPQLTHA